MPGPDPAHCPTDLCCYGECRCTPSEAGGLDPRWAMRALGLLAAALASLPVSGLAVHAVGAGLPVMGAVAVLLLRVGAWLLTRPSRPRPNPTPEGA